MSVSSMSISAMTQQDSRPASGRTLGSFLYERIQTGVLKPGDRIGTAKELSKKFNVSFGQARQSLEILAAKGVVTRTPRAGTFVSQDSVQGQTHINGNHSIFALLVPDLRQAEYAYISRYIQDEAHKMHLDVIVGSTDNDRDRYDQTIRRQIKSGISGMILVSPSYDRVSLETILELKNSGIPVVTLASSLEGTGWPTVRTDVFHGAYIAMKHLCEIGRKHIAFIGYEAAGYDKDSYFLKRSGIYKASLDSGCGTGSPVEWTVPLKYYSARLGWGNNPELAGFIGDCLDKNRNIDAICCDHDHIAAATLRLLRERNIKVPDEIAVMGSGNMYEFFGLVPGEITTVDTRFPEKAAELLKLLVAMQNGESIEPGTKIAFKPELVIGRSTVAR